MSFWQARSGWLPGKAEVVVIGGGLLGVSTAYWLAEAGLDPLLLEAGVPGAGASGRNAGFVGPGLAMPYQQAVAMLGRTQAREVHRSTIGNVALVRQLVAKEDIDCELSADGQLSLALGQAQGNAARKRAELLTADGFPIDVVEREELGRFIGTPVAAHVSGGLYKPDAVSVNPMRLVAGLAQAARRRGAQIMSGVQVRSIARNHGRIQLQTSAGPLSCAAAVVAVNAWTPALVPQAAGLVTPARAQMLAYAPAAPVFRVPTGGSVSPTGEYWRQTADGQIIIGGRRDLDVGFATTAQTPTNEVQAAVERVLPGLFPELDLPPVTTRWAGAMARTPDQMPIAGSVPDVPSAWFAVGCNGHGLAFAAFLGYALAQAVIDRHIPDVLEPFSPTRPTLNGPEHRFSE
ncbi:FAD-binding oxidoreductase [Nonomuraea sp. B1E8]|uniref:NAD(P)/FAD-dependent oxidoreductase n=1 Tax=unclassified Nonomuraea TaxID=2593643 RepID=UPI00325F6DBA